MKPRQAAGLGAKIWKRPAETLVEQRLSLTPVEPIAEKWRPQDEAEGYALQFEVNHQLSQAGLGHIVGHKVGCTTPVMQKFLGIPNPCAGSVFSETVRHGTASVRRSGFVKLGIECEIAIELDRNIFPSDGPFTREAMESAVHSVMVAIEIVDDRYQDYRTLGVPTLIADDFFNSGCVLGEPVTDWRRLDLARLAGTTHINGTEAGKGTGKLVMGHPLEALAWLALAARDGAEAGRFRAARQPGRNPMAERRRQGAGRGRRTRRRRAESHALGAIRRCP
jgi:2-keto-4-pentenoate hydratase